MAGRIIIIKVRSLIKYPPSRGTTKGEELVIYWN